MIQYIYRTRSLDRQLEKMLHSGKKGVLAVRQTEEIIDVFCSRQDSFQSLQHKQTKKGELRIDNCRKYDLGGGCRLITIQQGSHLFLTYAGSHDECNLWLEKHKDTPLNIASLKNSSQILHVTFSQRQAVKTPPPPDITQEPDQLEEDLFNRIDEKTLRSVFSGICQPK